MDERIEQAIEKAVAIFESEGIIVPDELVNAVRAKYNLPPKNKQILLIVRREETNEPQRRF